jgi:hypothetical protein
MEPLRSRIIFFKRWHARFIRMKFYWSPVKKLRLLHYVTNDRSL